MNPEPSTINTDPYTLTPQVINLDPEASQQSRGEASQGASSQPSGSQLATLFSAQQQWVDQPLNRDPTKPALSDIFY